MRATHLSHSPSSLSFTPIFMTRFSALINTLIRRRNTSTTCQLGSQQPIKCCYGCSISAATELPN